MVSHYDAATALRQKVGALAGRKEMQARDVFDLHHLLARGAAWSARNEGDQDRADLAQDTYALSEGSAFKARCCLPRPVAREQYDSTVWDTMVLEVVEALRGGSA